MPPRGELARPSRGKEGEESGVDVLFSPSPAPARPRRCAHRLSFCVLGSGTLTPHHPAEEIHLVAQPPASPAPPPKKTRQPPAPEGPSPRAGSPGLRHRSLLLSSRSGPLSPETATAASRGAHARGRGVTWRLEGRRQKGRGGSPGRRPHPPVRGAQTTPTSRPATTGARPLLLLALLAAAGRGHPRGRSPAQSAREALIRLRASAGRCFVAERDGLQAVKPEGLFC